LPIIQVARHSGFGCSDPARIEIVGGPLPPAPCPGFEPAAPAPVKFSFGRVCRSTARQILLLVKGSKA